jgi:hypothetical protein
MSGLPLPLPPNPYLVAILLVTKTKAGSTLVYHYPPQPTTGKSRSASDSDSDVDESDEQGNADGASSRPDSPSSTSKRRIAKSRVAGPAGTTLRDSIDEEKPEVNPPAHEKHQLPVRTRRIQQVTQDYTPEWESLLGFRVNALARFLSPSQQFNKRKFEVALDQLVFLGAPRFVKDDGTWQKERKVKQSNDNTQSSDPTNDLNDAEEDHDHDDDDAKALKSRYLSEATSVDSILHPPTYALSMFNVVFVLNPPASEHHIRVDQMYRNVVKKFSKNLKYAQAHNHFVYREARGMMAMKDHAKDRRTPMSKLWAQFSKQSSLARAIETTFKQISTDKIAHVSFGKEFESSFQIPQDRSTRFPPNPNLPPQSGLWLTTASQFVDDEPNTIWSQTRALLLLEDDDILLKEVESDAKELATPLAHFIRNLKPTKPLVKIAHACSMTTADVEQLSRHLIYWHRARAIPPLRPVDTYIVSPTADFERLYSDARKFKERWPAFLDLITFLGLLSTPRPYNHYMKSRANRDMYMDVLAWLFRHGWVVQLRTVGWLNVPVEAKQAVAKDTLAQIAKERENRLASETLFERRRRSRSTGPAPPSTRNQRNDDDRPRDLRGFFPDMAKINPQKFESSIIHDPRRASNAESRWIEYMRDQLDEEDRKLLEVILSYFDGHKVLEEISARENLKKRRVGQLMSTLISRDYLVTVKHW